MSKASPPAQTRAKPLSSFSFIIKNSTPQTEIGLWGVAFMSSYIHRKADACTSSKELYEVYRMLCEENSLNAIKPRGFSDALIANQRRYNLESTSNIVNSSGRRVRGFVGIEVLVQPDLSPNGWRAAIKPESDAGHRSLRLADNDKISRKGHRTAPRCCRCPFLYCCHSAHRQVTKECPPTNGAESPR